MSGGPSDEGQGSGGQEDGRRRTKIERTSGVQRAGT
jgi:hypothetical protein